MARSVYLMCLAALALTAADHSSLPQAQFERALAEASRGEFAAARQSYLAALKLRPDSVAILYNLGLVEVKLGRPRDAVLSLRRAARLASGDVTVWQALLAAEMEVKAPPHTVREVSSHLTGIAPREESFYVSMAGVLADKGYVEAAAAVLRHASTTWPSSWRLKHNLAFLYYSAGCVLDALFTVKDGLTVADEGPLHYLAGEIQSSLGNPDKSVESFQKAIRREPDNELYWFALGYALLQHRDFATALDIFVKATGRLPRSSKLHVGLSAAHFGRADYQQAASALRKAIELDPTSELGYLQLGRMIELLRDADLAQQAWVRSAFERYRHEQPQNPRAAYLLALAQPPESTSLADELLKLATQLEPRFAEAWLEIGKRRIATDPAEAALALRTFLKIAPDSAEGWYHLGRALLKLQRTEEGRMAMMRAADLRKQQEADVASHERKLQRFVYGLR